MARSNKFGVLLIGIGTILLIVMTAYKLEDSTFKLLWNLGSIFIIIGSAIGLAPELFDKEFWRTGKVRE